MDCSNDSQKLLASQIIQRHQSLKSGQSQFRVIWQECADYIRPRKGGINSTVTAGSNQFTQIYDTTAGESADIFAAGVMTQLTPAGELWARLSAKEGADQAERDWWDDCSQRMMKVIHGSNFYLGWHEDLDDAGIFGTSNLFVEESDKTVINCINVPIGTFTIAEDAEGMVDTVYREWEWTARQCEQKWGREALSKAMLDACDSKGAAEADRKFTIIHAVYPRCKDDVREGQVAGKLRPIASVYVEVGSQHVINEDGYYEMPHCCGRLLRSNGELYGRGPGTDKMVNIKLANRMKLDLLLALEKQVKPSWLMPDDNSSRPDNRPNGVTYWDASNPANKPEQIRNEGRVDFAMEGLKSEQSAIREGFFVNMFQMLSNADQMKRDKTAFEVSQLVQEKLLMFSPLFARITQEKLNVFMHRVFGICMRAGVFLPPPESVVAKGVVDYEVEYVSKIALAIRAAEDNSLVVMMQLVMEMMQFDPSVVHVCKWRDAFRRSASNKGFPTALIRTDEEVDKIMQGIAQQAAAAQAPEAMDKMAGAAQKLGPAGQRKMLEAIPV